MIKKFFSIFFKKPNLPDGGFAQKDILDLQKQANEIKVINEEIVSILDSKPFFVPRDRFLSHHEFLSIIKQEKHFSLDIVPVCNRDYYHKLIYYFRKKHKMDIRFDKTTNCYKYTKNEE
jgi:hypothetical protein